MKTTLENMKVILSLNEEQKVIKDKVMNGTVKVNPKQKKLLFIQEAEEKRNCTKNTQVYKGTFISVRQLKDGSYGYTIRLKPDQITGKAFAQLKSELMESYDKLAEFTK